MRHDVKRGAVLLMTSSLFLSLVNACQKSAGTQLPILEILFFRNFLSMPFVFFIASRTQVTLRTERLAGHALRSLFGLISMFLVLFVLTKLPLFEQQVFSYLQPIFVALFATFFFGETLSVGRQLAIGLGFCGVAIAASGRFATPVHLETPVWVYLVALSQGAFAALSTLQIRQLSKTEHSITITLWQAIFMTGATLVLMPFVWVTPAPGEAVLLLAIGTFSGAAQLFQTEAFASAQVSSIGAFLYFGLVWAGLIGWLWFGEVPGMRAAIGGLVIAGAGIWAVRSK
ncbi:DMT family transporter [Gluconobacter cerinus]|uniref:DMT family transporter n=1 Tax=Gluconobacter cerinus TaxID=38307 RepID=UPI0039EB8FC0